MDKQTWNTIDVTSNQEICFINYIVLLHHLLVKKSENMLKYIDVYSFIENNQNTIGDEFIAQCKCTLNLL